LRQRTDASGPLSSWLIRISGEEVARGMVAATSGIAVR
jgi:hypothetical protein